MRAWSFDVPPNAAVVTTTYVTRERLPICKRCTEPIWEALGESFMLAS
jgi:hypothetical protein